MTGRGKPNYWEITLPYFQLHATDPSRIALGLNPVLRTEKRAVNRLSLVTD
jgi:hypothetical protein